MKQVTLLSGLPREECQRVLGESAWTVFGDAWRDPDTLLEGRQGELAGTELIWFYRSPAMALLRACPLKSAEQVLEEWARRSRAAMNLRRVGLSRLIAVNIDAATTEDLARAWPALVGLLPHDLPPPVASPELATAVKWLLRWLAPAPSDVYDMLEAVAVTGRYVQGDFTDVDSVVLPLVDALRNGSVPDLSTGNNARPGLEEAERQARRAENLSRQLQQVREELDLCYLHARQVERDLSDHEADWREAYAARDRLREALIAEERLLSRLHEVQEKYELHQEELRQSLQALEGEREKRARADDKIRGLHLQLDFVLSEMRGEPLLPERSVPPSGGLRRIRGTLRRQLLGRINPRWTPAPTADADRARALEELAASRWFDRDWYVACYADVNAAGSDPVKHYHDHGWSEGRDPGPDFSTRFYLETYPDVAASGMVPLLHFIRHGLKEGRVPRAL